MLAVESTWGGQEQGFAGGRGMGKAPWLSLLALSLPLVHLMPPPLWAFESSLGRP